MQSTRNCKKLPHNWWENAVPKPIINSDDDQLMQMEQNQQEYVASRCQSLIKITTMNRQSQEAIIMRICGRSEIKEDLKTLSSTMETNKKASMKEPTKQRKGLEVKTTEMEHAASRPSVHLKPFVIYKLFHLLKFQDSLKKLQGLKIVHALAKKNPDILLPSLHDICLAVLQEVCNRHSRVTHAAIRTLTHLFDHLRNDMDNECQITAAVLLDRFSESTEVIREALDMALMEMVYSCSPVHVTNALLKGGASHVDPLVRNHMMQCLFKQIQITGISHLVMENVSTTPSFLFALSKLAQDPEMEVRSVVQNILLFSDIEKKIIKMIDIFVPENDRRGIKELTNKFRSRILNAKDTVS
ncbi:TOG array regulator of axonemal microtubules protein 1-like [Tachysurus fulvidraco]|uniref:TOG array regulator of axonemal microtubules protein 1-like n=1 Tax=Tachysurus fulvidraco TaxID=1234273 RepID=UPI001FEF7480|nr:TOG array regulator of axonemal microtubules protein 1-like [Tachysurus fulvidraco]